MTKLIGLKELQTKTKYIREEVAKGTRFIVVYRSQPAFQIQPLSQEETVPQENSQLPYPVYTASRQVLEAEKKAVKEKKSGKMKTFRSPADLSAFFDDV